MQVWNQQQIHIIVGNTVFSSYLHRLFFILAPSFLHTCTVFSSYFRSAQTNIYLFLSIVCKAVIFLYNLSYKLFTTFLTNPKQTPSFLHRMLLCQNIFPTLSSQGRANGAFISALTRLLGYNAARGATGVAPH